MESHQSARLEHNCISQSARMHNSGSRYWRRLSGSKLAFPALSELTMREDDDFSHRVAGRLGHRRRRAYVLSGTNCERVVSAHGDRAVFAVATCATDRLRVAARRRREHVSRLYSRRCSRCSADATIIDVGVKVSSVPAQGEKPQTFETSNRSRLAPNGTPCGRR